MLKVSPRILQNYRNNGICRTISRQQDFPSGFRHKKNPDIRVQGGVHIQKKLIAKASPQRTRKDFDSFRGSAVCRLLILFVFLKKVFPNEKNDNIELDLF